MSQTRFVISLVLSSIFGGMIALAGFYVFNQPKKYTSIEDHQKVLQANYPAEIPIKVPDGLDFRRASTLVRPAVVHIKISHLQNASSHHNREEYEDLFRQFPGDNYFRSFPRQSTGSGVIVSDDGYLVTNYHVIDEATSIEVILYDKRSYEAELIGTDPSTDLALLKINEINLPFVKYGDSESLQIGEWVLAVGNPFDLTSTVTAGIVSAKGRNINLLKDNYAIESFIQTDAAVNPGNSGGALVNLKGELIGVNTAIATHTGYYSGYSFAIPITIVKKVMDDLMNYGEIQRALLGVTIREVDAVLAQEKNLKDIGGVYLLSVKEDGAAGLAGLEVGDIIKTVDKTPTNSAAELQAIIATHRPGDKVEVLYERGGFLNKVSVLLRNKTGNTQLFKKEEVKKTLVLGAELGSLSQSEKLRLGIKDGVKVVHIYQGKIKESGMEDGFIITKVDDRLVSSPEEVSRIIQKKRKTIAIDGLYPNGDKAYYAIGW
ncbi:MAG: trypsin-like peptidase domain-containing protein [Microscillaceae bacterium]|nr:trypsin-like peptidase domain-containing protein [Microscillaceae bacterium]